MAMKSTVEQFVQGRARVVKAVSDVLENSETQATALAKTLNDGSDGGHLHPTALEEQMTSVMRELADPSASLDDRLDIALAAARMLTTGPERFTLDEVLAQLGYTREQLAAIPD